MRCFYFALAALTLATCASAAHHRHHGAVRKMHHKTRSHHSKSHHLHQERKHQAKHHTLSYAGMQQENNELLEMTMIAEAQLIEASSHLEEILYDMMPNVSSTNATSSSLRGASKVAKNVSTAPKLPANVTANLKFQQGKLTDLFKHLKSNIAEFNKREADQKHDSKIYAERLKKRIEEDKKRLKDSKLSDFEHELLINRTRTEEHELKFWSRGRELEHDMFHSNLKLTHGMMSRVKTVMEAYKQMLTHGKVDPTLAHSLHETSKSLPKVFLQRELRVRKDVKKLGKHLKISARLLQRD